MSHVLMTMNFTSNACKKDEQSRMIKNYQEYEE